MRHIQLGTLAIVFFAIPFESVQAMVGCSQWLMPSRTAIKQSNETVISVEISSSQGGFVGKASYYSHFRRAAPFLVNGVLEGRMNGSSVQFTIHWQDDYNTGVKNATGVYIGTVGPQGRLEGTSYDVAHPQSRASWWANEALQCRVVGKTLGRALPRR
jgi:hypothetical protein